MLKGLRSPEGAQHRPGFWEGLWNELERGLILEMRRRGCVWGAVGRGGAGTEILSATAVLTAILLQTD